jgi:hypothetical protein
MIRNYGTFPHFLKARRYSDSKNCPKSVLLISSTGTAAASFQFSLLLQGGFALLNGSYGPSPR